MSLGKYSKPEKYKQIKIKHVISGKFQFEGAQFIWETRLIKVLSLSKYSKPEKYKRIKIKHVICVKWGQENPNPREPSSFGNKAHQVLNRNGEVESCEFQCSHLTPMINSFSHNHSIYNLARYVIDCFTKYDWWKKEVSQFYINKYFHHKIVNIFLPINFNICFGGSKRTVSLRRLF